MIARNYIRFPEALRFQREMFSNGYHNSPRIMRLIECMFAWTASIPEWVKDAKRKALALVKSWKKAQIVLNFHAEAHKTGRTSKVGYVWGTGPNNRTPFFENLLATGRSWESIVADDRYFRDI